MSPEKQKVKSNVSCLKWAKAVWCRGAGVGPRLVPRLEGCLHVTPVLKHQPMQSAWDSRRLTWLERAPGGPDASGAGTPTLRGQVWALPLYSHVIMAQWLSQQRSQ